MLWPVAGIVSGILVAIIDPEAAIPLQVGIAAWCANMVLVLILSAHPVGVRVGVLMAGLFMAVPCWVAASPLARGLLMCAMGVPFIAAAALVLAPPIAGGRARLAFLCSWCGTRAVKRRARSLDTGALRDLIVAAMVLAAAIAGVKAASVFDLGLVVRWLVGGIGVFAFAEMVTACLPLVTAALGLTVPALFQSPYRSASVGEFWTKRWNLGVSELFRWVCFAPLARRGVGLAMFTTFAVSAVAHAALAHMTLGRWRMSFICGAFFLVQPLFIAAERWMKVRRWRPWAAWAWTLAVLAITSPMFVEPALQIIEKSWGPPDNVLLPTVASLGATIIATSVVAVASLSVRPAAQFGR